VAVAAAAVAVGGATLDNGSGLPEVHRDYWELKDGWHGKGAGGPLQYTGAPALLPQCVA